MSAVKDTCSRYIQQTIIWYHCQGGTPWLDKNFIIIVVSWRHHWQDGIHALVLSILVLGLLRKKIHRFAIHVGVKY